MAKFKKLTDEEKAEAAVIAECKKLEKRDAEFTEPEAIARAKATAAAYGQMTDEDRAELEKALAEK